MILAGGQGSRLKQLTEDLAKPAVAFGGKYRINRFHFNKLLSFWYRYCWSIDTI